jgi:anti-sigma B factor antagonist
LHLQQHSNGDVVVLDVNATRAETAAPGALGDKIRALLEHGHRFIILNVADLAYVDSVWLGAIIQGYASAIRHGGALKLVHVSTRFRDLLRVTKLDAILERFDSEHDAAASFAKRAARPGASSPP